MSTVFGLVLMIASAANGSQEPQKPPPVRTGVIADRVQQISIGMDIGDLVTARPMAITENLMPVDSEKKNQSLEERNEEDEEIPGRISAEYTVRDGLVESVKWSLLLSSDDASVTIEEVVRDIARISGGRVRCAVLESKSGELVPMFFVETEQVRIRIQYTFGKLKEKEGTKLLLVISKTSIADLSATKGEKRMDQWEVKAVFDAEGLHWVD